MTAALGVIAAVTIPFVRTSLVPEFADRNVLVRLEGQPGVSNQVMTQRATDVTKALAAVPGVTATGAHDRPRRHRRPGGQRQLQRRLGLGRIRTPTTTTRIAAIKQAALGVPDVTSEVVSYSTQKMRDVGALAAGTNQVSGSQLDVLTGLDQPLAVRMFGQDQAVLAQQADKIRQLMAGVDGVVDPRVDVQPTQADDRDRGRPGEGAARRGLTR